VFDEEGELKEEHDNKAIDKMLAQLEWHGHALRNHRHHFGTP
jgi:hypothetical protein